MGLKQPNAFGLYDMLGNVWEWCLGHLQCYPSDYQIDPIHTEMGSGHVYRGGGWETLVRSTTRDRYHSDGLQLEHRDSIGFRWQDND